MTVDEEITLRADLKIPFEYTGDDAGGLLSWAPSLGTCEAYSCPPGWLVFWSSRFALCVAVGTPENRIA